MGPYGGGQAEYLRVPHGDFNCLKLPEDAVEKQNDYVMLSDVFPQDITQPELAGVKPGDSVVIYGAGPVGLMAAHSASIKPVKLWWWILTDSSLLKLCHSIDFSKGSAVEQVLELTKGVGADRVANVGYQCCDKHGTEHLI
jgi:threonine dehydrogenase-like Zn-dependent dehydrogenase